MEELKEKYKKELKNILNNKAYITTIIFVVILAYGYFITHVTIGMDDTCLDRYYGEMIAENMISSGRWGSYLVYKLINVDTFTPFWLETLTIFILVITAILLSCFIKKNLRLEKTNICTVFSCIYISYPLFNEPLIFQPSNLAVFLGNFLTILSLIIIYEVMESKKIKKVSLVLIPMLGLAISMYEACCQTFLVGLLMCIEFRLIRNKDTFKELVRYLITGIAILFFSIVFNYIVLLLFYFIGIPNNLGGGRTIYWFQYGIIDGIKIVLNNIKESTINKIYYFPVFEFVISVIIGYAFSVYYSIKHEDIKILIIFCLIIASNFALAILQCTSVLYRTTISWAMLVTTIFTIMYVFLYNNKYLKEVAFIIATLIILWQTKDTSQWFYSEYIKYQTDLKDAYHIAEDIREKVIDLNKPVVFVGIPNKGFQTNGQAGAQSNGLSVVWWGQKAFDDNSYELIKFINLLGYNFYKPTDEQYEQGKVLSQGMASYPKEGYIKEFENIVVVKFD